MRLLPILFGFSYAAGCPNDQTKDTDTGEVCEVVSAPCPEPYEYAVLTACSTGYWTLILQCETAEDESCVFADHALMNPNGTLYATCDRGLYEVRATLCGC